MNTIRGAIALLISTTACFAESPPAAGVHAGTTAAQAAPQAPADAAAAQPAGASPPAPTSPNEAAAANSPDSPAPAEDAPMLSKEEASYMLGVNYGVVMRNYDIVMEIVPDAVARGFKDGLAGKKNSPEDQKRIKAFISMVQPVAAQFNLAAANDFLSRNAHEKGVRTTPSGLQYKILAEGDAHAAPPKPGDLVALQFRGTLLDGTEFDKSRSASTFYPLDSTLKAWQEALVQMKPGAKWQLFVPPALGFGMKPHPGIPGGALVIYDLELVKVKPGDGATDAPPAADAKKPGA